MFKVKQLYCDYSRMNLEDCIEKELNKFFKTVEIEKSKLNIQYLFQDSNSTKFAILLTYWED